jgi:hypothetical protein
MGMDSGRRGEGHSLSVEGTLCSPRRLGCRSEHPQYVTLAMNTGRSGVGML